MGAAPFVSPRSLLFIDFDDVLCLNRPYGGYDVARSPWADDLLQKLWHRPALDVLQPLVAEFRPRVIVTSSWLRLMPIESIAKLFRMSGAPWLADGLHPQGEAPQAFRASRLGAIDAWLAKYHDGEPYVILDDVLSGTGLAGSEHDRAGLVVLCEVEVGLLPEHSAQIQRALASSIG